MNKAEQYIYRVEWSPEDKSFLATCAELPSLSFLDVIQMEAFVGIINLVRDAVADMVMKGETIPEPLCLRPPTDINEVMEQPDHQAIIQDLTAKLDAAADVLWDQALPCMFDVEHQISYHADTVPQQYRKLAQATQKALDIVNFRPDPG